MAIHLRKVIRAPIDEVFEFFDDPLKMLEFNEHAVHFDVVDAQPDGRRTFDVVMRAGAKQWMQTVEQVVREPPTRLLTRGGSWTTDRRQWLLTVTTDRYFSADGDGTDLDATVETNVDHPFHHPLRAILNWVQQGAARAEFERQLDAIATRIEGVTGRG
jgi:hypothetical protein